MKKSAFTLAEVLVTLTIIGVIAILTIPSLLQETQKREEITQIKKGFSELNQALGLNYVLEEKTLSDLGAQADSNTAVSKMLNDRLKVSKSDETKPFVETVDGLSYFIYNPSSCSNTDVFNQDGSVNSQAKCAEEVYIITSKDAINKYNSDSTNFLTPATLNNLTGCYQFIATYNGIVPTKETAKILDYENQIKDN